MDESSKAQIEWALGVLDLSATSSIEEVKGAYRDLVSVWHPDKHDGNERLRLKATEKTRELNRARDVLTSPWAWNEETRTWYGCPKIQSGNSGTAKRETADNSPRESVQQEKLPNEPKEPKLTDYGLEDNYLDNLNAGAKLWKERRKAVETPILVTGIGAAGLMGFIGWLMLKGEGMLLPWEIDGFNLVWILPIAWYFAANGINQLHDSVQLKKEFKPRFHPEPQKYEQYAAAMTEYRTQIYIVYVSRSGRYHSNSYCCGMMASTPMPKWKADVQHYSACGHCGNFRLLLRNDLPKPFGLGDI